MENFVLTKDRNDLVVLELDRPRTLCLSHSALKRFSALTKCTLDAFDSSMKDYEKMSALLWVMVTEEQKESKEEMMSPEHLDSLLSKYGIKPGKILNLCAQAVSAAFEDEEAEEENDNPPQSAAGTGIKA